MNDGDAVHAMELEEQTGEKRKRCILANNRTLYIVTFSINTIAIVLAIVSISQILGFKLGNRRDSENSSQTYPDLYSQAHEILPFMIGKIILGNNHSDTAKTRWAQHKPTLDASPATAHKCIGTSESIAFPEFGRTHVLIQLNVTLFNKCEHSRGVRVTNEGFVLQYDGLYYVYSNINFKPSTTKSSSDFPYQTWFHYVNRESPNHPMNTGVLLRSAHTCCPNCTNRGESSYTGGLFYLKADDILRVSLSGDGIAEFNNQTSYLGLFMLASSRP